MDVPICGELDTPFYRYDERRTRDADGIPRVVRCVSRRAVQVFLLPTARHLQGVQTSGIFCNGLGVVYRPGVGPRPPHNRDGVHRVLHLWTGGKGASIAGHIRSDVPRTYGSNTFFFDPFILLESTDDRAQ